MSALPNDLKLTIEAWPVDRPIESPRNNKIHTEESTAKLAKSMTELGQIQPIIVGKDDVIIAGHGRLRAARKLGWAKIKVIQLPVDELTARRMRIADNLMSNDKIDLDNLSAELNGIAEELGVTLDVAIETVNANDRTADLVKNHLKVDLDLDGLTADPSGDAAAMEKENAEKMAAADDELTGVAGILGFGKITAAQARRLKPIVKPIVKDKADPAEAFIAWLETRAYG